MDELHREVSRWLLSVGVGRAAPVLVAVSGGADSVALLRVLISLGQRVGVGHVHHGLRGAEADRDLAFVRALARALGVPFHVEHVDARTADGSSPEARARSLRYPALERMRSGGGYDWVATAHSLEDQAETVLLRAVRGTGLGGLSGIRPILLDRRVIRPLLGIRRAAVRGYLETRGHAWCEDATNEDRAVPRNCLRHEVLPQLERIHPGAVERLASLADLARVATEAAHLEIVPIVEACTEAGEGGLWIDPAGLVRLPQDLRRRALAAILARLGREIQPTRGHLERMDAMLGSMPVGRSLSLPSGMTLLCDRDRLWVGPEKGPHLPHVVRQPLVPLAPIEFPERDLRLEWHAPSRMDVGGPDVLQLTEHAARALWVRSARPQDRVRVGASMRERRLKDVFAAARWSRRQRARAIVVELEGELVWVPGLAKARDPLGEGASAWQLVARPLSRDRASC
jgi:tRNA(Ile)-lysidine synthase